MSETNDFIADPRRVLLGMFAAPVVPSFAAEIPTFKFLDFWPLAMFGFLSIITLYLPWVLWKLRRTRHPFLTCVLIGGLSAPGLLGYVVGIVAGLAGFPAAVIGIIMVTLPLGLIGGAVFWLCAVWRSEGWESAGAEI